jgi:aspartyl-tRNA(Asn)/glutamyl-tRNA(Gln) amidotransferase subunit A
MTEGLGTVHALRDAYDRGIKRPDETVRATLAAIEKSGDPLNAWQSLDPSRAQADADRHTETLAGGTVDAPLKGIPVAVKDLMDVAGLTTGCGSPVHAPEPAVHDATLVARLKAAGAVVLGKTNCLEHGYGVAHPDVGQTLNPHAPARTAGGSSGGSAAAVANGEAAAATGTDTGGSIRIPAAYCGLAGLKPTHDLVPLEGVQPLSWSLDTAGPIARCCADLAILAEVMAGRSMSANIPPIRGLKLGILSEHANDPDLTSDVGDAFAAAVDRLAAAGATIEWLSVPDVSFADDALMTVIGPEASVIHEDRIKTDPDAYAEATRTQLETGFALPATAYVRAQRYRRHLGYRLRAAMSGLDAIVTPTVPWTAPAENPPLDDPEGAAEMRYIAPYNLTGLPALTVPCGVAGDGLPVGFQIAGRPNQDAELLALGQALEPVLQRSV